MDGHSTALVLHAMDPAAGERKRLAGAVLGDAPCTVADYERLVASATFEHVDADAGTAVVVVARVTRFPPQVEPGLRMLVTPEELERAFAAPLESGEVDELGRRAGKLCAFLGSQVVVGRRQSFEAAAIDHGFILHRSQGIVEYESVSRIARVEAWPANTPLEAPYVMAPGTVAGICRTIVRVTTEDGIVGLGESASPSDATLVTAELGQGFVGRDTDAVRAELGREERAQVTHRTDGKVLIDKPLTGIEIALWDVAAREAGVPLYELLGGACRTAIAFSEYFAYRPGHDDSPSAVAAFCARMVEEHDSPVFEGKVAVRPVEEDVELVREIRAAIGPDRTLRLDANMGWRLETAQQALSLVEPFDIANVEEPVASFAKMAELRRSTAIPFSAHTPDPALASSLGVPDTLVLGLGSFGGIAGTRRFIETCERAGVGFWFYSGDFGIATAAYLQIAAATPYLVGPSQSLLRWTVEDVIMGGPFSPECGVLDVPTGHGLGVELDEAALARCVERHAREGAYDFYAGGPLPRY